MNIRKIGQCCLLAWLAIVPLQSKADTKKTFTALMPDQTLRKMTTLVQTDSANDKTTVTTTLEGSTPFVYTYVPLNSDINSYQLEHRGRRIPATAITSENLNNSPLNQETYYWLVDSPPFIGPSGTLLLPVFQMDSEAPPASGTLPRAETNEGASPPTPASVHFEASHYTFGLVSVPSPALEFSIITEPSGQLFQASNEFYRITSAGPPEDIFYECSKTVNDCSDDESSLSEHSDTDELAQLLGKLDFSLSYHGDNNDNDPSSLLSYFVNLRYDIHKNSIPDLSPSSGMKGNSGEWYLPGYDFTEWLAPSSITMILLMRAFMKKI